MATETVTELSNAFRRPRARAGVVSAAYVFCLLAFLLPFASASCDTSGAPSTNPAGGGATSKAESKALTGWELVQGKQPEINEEVYPSYLYPASPEHEARDEVIKAIDSFRVWIEIAFFAILIALAVSLEAAYQPSEGISWALLIAGVIPPLAFFVAFTVGAHSDTEGSATIHHHIGFWLAVVMAGGAVALEGWLLDSLRPVKPAAPGTNAETATGPPTG